MLLQLPAFKVAFWHLLISLACASTCLAVNPWSGWATSSTRDRAERALIRKGPRLSFGGIKSGNIQRGMIHSVRQYFGQDMPPVIRAVSGFRQSNEIPFTHFRVRVWDRKIGKKQWREVPGTGPEGTHVIPLPPGRDFTTPEGVLFTHQEVGHRMVKPPDTKKPSLPTWVHVNKLDQHGELIDGSSTPAPRLWSGNIRSKDRPAMWHGYEGEMALHHKTYHPPILRTAVGASRPHVRDAARESRLKGLVSKKRTGGVTGPFLSVAHHKLVQEQKVVEAAFTENKRARASSIPPETIASFSEIPHGHGESVVVHANSNERPRSPPNEHGASTSHAPQGSGTAQLFARPDRASDGSVSEALP